MIFSIRFSILCLLAFSLWSCGKDDPDPVPPVTPPVGYIQYGTPFADVPATKDIVMYEVNLRAFSASGDIQGIIQRLDQIDSLGINVIWLMPIHPIGQLNSVNSPYSIKDHKAVSPEFGTLADVRQLTDAAHARGMAVILDWVANHTAWDHVWINKRSWYTQDVNGSIIHPPGTNWQDVADLNYDSQAMRNAMIDAMHYWVYEANVDGFRCDYADGVPFDFWQKAWQSLDTIPNRDFILFAEGTRADHFTAGFDLNFGWTYYGTVKDVFNGQGAGRLFTAHTQEYNQAPANKHWIRFTTNHDESAWDETPVQLFNGINGALAASVATIFTGGVPLIYGSQEVGMAQNVPFFSNSIIPWNNNPTMLDAYQKMLGFYSSSEVARHGVNTVYAHNDIAAFKKTYQQEELVILVNVRNSMINYVLPAELKNTTWTDVMNQSPIQLEEQLTLSPYQYFILVP